MQHARTRLLIVDDDPTPCRFSGSLQSAVDAARSGDVILVKPGGYGQVVISGKSLCMIGEGHPYVAFRILNLQAHQSVVVRGMEKGSGSSQRISDNAGPVWLEDCVLLDRTGIDDSAFVGWFSMVPDLGGFGLPASSLAVDRSTVVAYGSDVRGRRGDEASWDDCDLFGATRETAIFVRDTSSVFLSDCLVLGGDGAEGYSGPFGCGFTCMASSDGGDGLDLQAGTQAVVFDVAIEGGEPGPPVPGGNCEHAQSSGTPVVGAGTLTTLPGSTARYSAASPVIVGAPIAMEFSGPPGWNAFVTYSDEFAPVHVPDRKGWSVVPESSPTLFVGTIPGSGLLQVALPVGDLLDPRDDAGILYTQAKFYDPISGVAVLGTPSAVVFLRQDCP